MADSGGRAYFSLNGKRYSPRGKITITPTSFQRDKGLNQDGTLYTSVKPEPAEAELSFSDQPGIAVQDLAYMKDVDVTIELFDRKCTWLFSKATVTGRPKIDTETGEISGLMISSAAARIVEQAA